MLVVPLGTSVFCAHAWTSLQSELCEVSAIKVFVARKIFSFPPNEWHMVDHTSAPKCLSITDGYSFNFQLSESNIPNQRNRVRIPRSIVPSSHSITGECVYIDSLRIYRCIIYTCSMGLHHFNRTSTCSS